MCVWVCVGVCGGGVGSVSTILYEELQCTIQVTAPTAL